MSNDLIAQVFIDCPILEAFKYVADPENLPKWVPFYSRIEAPLGGAVETGDTFTGVLSVLPSGWARFLIDRLIRAVWAKLNQGNGGDAAKESA